MKPAFTLILAFLLFTGSSITPVFGGGIVYTAKKSGDFFDKDTWSSTNGSYPVPVSGTNAVIKIDKYAVTLSKDFKVASLGSITLTGNGSLTGNYALYLGSGYKDLNSKTSLNIGAGCTVNVKQLTVHRGYLKVEKASASNNKNGTLKCKSNLVLYNATYSGDGDTDIEGNCDRMGTPVCGKGHMYVRGKMYVRACHPRMEDEDDDRQATTECALDLCVKNEDLPKSECSGPATSKEFEDDDHEDDDEDETSCKPDEEGHYCRPLPVELSLFTARATTRPSVELHWMTASERNSESFTVERSADGTAFKDIYTLAGAGNTQRATTYDFADESPLPGPAFYRLRQRDIDGTTSFSPPTRVLPIRSANSVLAVYPGTSTQTWTVSATLPADVLAAGTSTVQVFDMLGRVQNATYSPNESQAGRWILGLNGLAPGIYMVRLKTDVGTFSQRITL